MFVLFGDSAPDEIKEEFVRIKAAAKRIQEQSQVLVVIGIGDSYLGARAGLEFVKGPFGNQLREKGVEVYFAGSNLSADYMQDKAAPGEWSKEAWAWAESNGKRRQPSVCQL